MNITSANLSLINNPNLEGSVARQEYGIAIAAKINEQIQREGEAVVKLIDSTPNSENPGSNLNSYA